MRLFVVLLTAALLAVSTDAAAQNPPRGGNSTLRPARPADDPVAMIPDGDLEMRAAVAEAKRTLPLFWSLFETDRTVRGTAKLKMAFPTPDGGHEHMWLRDIRRENGVITGVLENLPDAPMRVKKGDTVTVDPTLISDWLYERGGRMYGSFTTRAMLKYLSPQMADEMRQLLSDRPLEGIET